MSFDLAKYQTTSEPRKVTVEISETGDSFEVTVKDLSWSKQNKLLSDSVQIGKNGETAFNGDAYVKAFLKEYIVEAPWGKTTEAFLISIDSRLGKALESLVPKLDEDEDMSADTAELKKA
tara:strand:+ start:193 stop:552 length:360 start_codon:yes stop_codon:yes gene_type:complete